MAEGSGATAEAIVPPLAEGSERATPALVPKWSALPPRAKAFRVAHLAWGVVAMSALGYIWASAIGRRRDRYLGASVAFLLAQGVALVIGRGNCPAGPFQRRLGDPVPMFELILPPRAAKAAIPALLWVTIAGMLAVVARPPRKKVD